MAKKALKIPKRGPLAKGRQLTKGGKVGKTSPRDIKESIRRGNKAIGPRAAAAGGRGSKT